MIYKICNLCGNQILPNQSVVKKGFTYGGQQIEADYFHDHCYFQDLNKENPKRGLNKR